MSKKPAARRNKPMDFEEFSSAAHAIYGKIERAHEHIGDLRAKMERFLESDPYEIIYEGDAHTGKRHVRWLEHAALPSLVPIIAGDVLHNLRSALDHMYALLVETNGYEVDRRDQFPITESAESYKTARSGVVDRIGPDALSSIDALEPYKGGCDAIWGLHRLNIIDKHRALMTTGVSCDRRGFLEQMPEEVVAFPSEGTDPPLSKMSLRPLLKHGDILARGIPRDKANDEVNLTVEIAFNEPGVIDAEPLIQTLDRMAQVTKRVIDLLIPLARKRVRSVM